MYIALFNHFRIITYSRLRRNDCNPIKLFIPQYAVMTSLEKEPHSGLGSFLAQVRRKGQDLVQG